ncbi:hypothetical protein GVAV_000278 [Gurleya vavrai]
MRSQEIEPVQYLDKNFDYKKLTKLQLIQIMLKNNIKKVPNIQTRKDKIIELYEKSIYNRIDEIQSEIEKINSLSTNQNRKKRLSKLEENSFNESTKNNFSVNERSYKTNSKISINSEINDKSQNETKFSFLREPKQINLQDKNVSLLQNESISKKMSLINDDKESEKNDRNYLSKENSFIESFSPQRKTKKESLKNNQSILHEDIKKEDSRFKSLNFKNSKSNIETFIKHKDKIKGSKILDENELIKPRKKSLSKINQSEIFIKHLNDKKSKFTKYVKLILIIFLSIIIYLKYFCPYCQNNELLCVKLPKKAKFLENEIVCEKGYVFNQNLFFKNACVIDKSKEFFKKNLVRVIVEELRYKNNEFINGLIFDNKISKDKLKFYIQNCLEHKKIFSLNEKCIKEFETNKKYRLKENIEKHQNEIELICENIIKGILNKYVDIKSESNFLYSTKKKFYFKIALRYYLKIFFELFILPFFTLILIYLIVRFINYNRKKREDFRKRKQRIVKDIFDALIGQKMGIGKKTELIPYIAVNQFIDYFNCEKLFWNEIMDIVRNNTNVKEYILHDEESHFLVWEWIGPFFNIEN